VCVAVAISTSDLPANLLEVDSDRLHNRGGESELRFAWRSTPPLLPVWWHGKLQIVRWGNRNRNEPRLPPTGWTWQATVESGTWSTLEPEAVDIPASFAFMGGIWYKLKQGIRGLLVPTRSGEPVVFMICEPATRYYRVMTRAEWMPLLIGEVI